MLVPQIFFDQIVFKAVKDPSDIKESRELLLGCKFWSRFRSLMGQNSVGTRNEAQSSCGAVSDSVIFSSTWRQLNLNFLNIGFSFRCKGSKTIDKPSPNVLGLLCSGGGGFKSADGWKCFNEKLAERRNLNWNIPGQKTTESGTEQKLRREFLRNLQPSLEMHTKHI